MAACGSLRSIFDNPLPEKPTMIDPLSSWNPTKSKKPFEPASFSEIFGELYFHEKPEPPGNSPRQAPTSPPQQQQKRDASSLDSLLSSRNNRYRGDSKSSESLQLCTEGLGSESSDEVEDSMNADVWRSSDSLVKEERDGYSRSYSDVRSKSRSLPPPISSIGRGGKPSVCFKSFREGGRFVLREVRIPTQEFLHASRQDGRLKLHFVHPNVHIAEGEEEGIDEDEDQEMEMECQLGSGDQKGNNINDSVRTQG